MPYTMANPLEDTCFLIWQELVEGTPAGKLVLYPQVFLTAVALLDLPWVHLHAVALRLFSTVRPRRSNVTTCCALQLQRCDDEQWEGAPSAACLPTWGADSQQPAASASIPTNRLVSVGPSTLALHRGC